MWGPGGGRSLDRHDPNAIHSQAAVTPPHHRRRLPRRSRVIAVEDLKRTHRATWASGDYAAVAERIDEVPPRDLLERVPVRAGDEVLDVATGTGNVALPAAAAGASVIGLDLTPELFGTARRRAYEQGVEVEWVE